MTKPVLILVNHLQGAGHLARALNLGRAFAHAGHDTHILSGGFPVAQFDTTEITLHQMPPIRADGSNFSRLLDDQGQDATDAYHDTRVAFARDVLNRVRPALLVVELFPFGRRNLKAEYLQILDNASLLPTPPVITGSLRDILSPPSKPSKVTFAEDTLHRFFTAVCVHSEHGVVPLEASWPVSDFVRPFLHYTGFVLSLIHI